MRPVRIAIACILTGLIWAPAAHAQTPADPLVAHVEEKAAEAQRDPAGYAQRQGSADGVRDEADWTVAYSCQALRDAGVPPPHLGPCRPRPEAVGVEEDAAEAQDLGEAGELGKDLEDHAAAVVDDPSSAPQEFEKLLEEVVGLVDSVVRGLLGLVAEVGGSANGVVEGVSGTVAGILDGAVSSAVEVPVSAADAAAGAGGAIGSAVESAGDVVDSVLDRVLGREPEPMSRDRSESEGMEPDERAESLLDSVPCVECVARDVGA